jgi:hypothetical protein
VKSKFGKGMHRVGLDLVREKLVETSGCTIALNLQIMNLEKLLEIPYILIATLYGLVMAWIASDRISTPLIPFEVCLAAGSGDHEARGDHSAAGAGQGIFRRPLIVAGHTSHTSPPCRQQANQWSAQRRLIPFSAASSTRGRPCSRCWVTSR